MDCRNLRAVWVPLTGAVLIVASCQKQPLRESNQSSVDYTFFLDGSGSPRRVFYEVNQGIAVAEGDISLGTAEEARRLRYAVEAGRSARGAIAIDSPDRLWPGGVIPYSVDSGLTDSERVTEAIAHIEANTLIRFVQRKEEEDYVAFTEDPELCISAVGRKTGRQLVRLAKKCSLGTVIHEIGHVVGLWHEQSRLDRDDYVEVLWDNIKEGKDHNFKQHLHDGKDLGDYDFESIMHYSATAFSTNGDPTLKRKDGGTDGFGQRKGLSAGDKTAIESLYGLGGTGGELSP